MEALEKNQDLYELFGVPNDADEATIKTAYRKKALVIHPDKNPDDPQATENFRHLTEALTILTNPIARKSYDLKRNNNNTTTASSDTLLTTAPNKKATAKQTADKCKQTADKSKQTADHRRRKSSSSQHHTNSRYDHKGRENKYENMFNAFTSNNKPPHTTTATASSSRPKNQSEPKRRTADIFMTEIPSELFSQKHQSDIKNYNEKCVYGVFVQEIVDKTDNQKKPFVYTLKSFSIGIGILIILTVLTWHHLRDWNYAEDPALTLESLISSTSTEPKSHETIKCYDSKLNTFTYCKGSCFRATYNIFHIHDKSKIVTMLGCFPRSHEAIRNDLDVNENDCMITFTSNGKIHRQVIQHCFCFQNYCNNNQVDEGPSQNNNLIQNFCLDYCSTCKSCESTQCKCENNKFYRYNAS